MSPDSHVAPTAGGGGSKFKLIAELGRGGMATVYLAVVRGPAGFNKLLVLKFLRPSLAADTELLDMFLAEARLAARISHPAVIQTNEIGLDERGLYYIAMEYVEGLSLDIVDRKAGGAFPIPLQLHVLTQALHGLHHAHELCDLEGAPLNVVHRDVSPHNIMISYDGHVKLVDFGIAKAADSSGNTRTGVLKGKCAYMAAEQFGGHDVDRRADIFAAGVILWQALTGRRLWEGLSDAEIFAKLARGEIASPLSVRPDLPTELVDICTRALAAKREDRFATAADFAAALEEFSLRTPGYHATTRELAEFLHATFASERAAIRSKVDAQLHEATRIEGDLVSVAAPESVPIIGAPARRAQSSIVLRALLVAASVFTLGAALVFAASARERALIGHHGGANGVGAAQSRVVIHAVPESAKIYFDDAPLLGNPAVMTFQRDGLAHRVRAEAPGHTGKTELIILDSGTLSVELELEHEDELVDPFGNKLTQLTFKALPASARLFVDDVLLPANPSVAKLPRDGRDHILRADAPSFVMKTLRVRFDAARLPITWTLDPVTGLVAKRAPGLPVPTTARTATEETAAAQGGHATVVVAAAPPTTVPRKPLDREDPWPQARPGKPQE